VQVFITKNYWKLKNITVKILIFFYNFYLGCELDFVLNIGNPEKFNEININGNIKTSESCDIKLNISFKMGNLNEKVKKFNNFSQINTFSTFFMYQQLIF